MRHASIVLTSLVLFAATSAYAEDKKPEKKSSVGQATQSVRDRLPATPPRINGSTPQRITPNGVQPWRPQGTPHVYRSPNYIHVPSPARPSAPTVTPPSVSKSTTTAPSNTGKK
jgi:hypothetical protein